jgi:hypothetical protein
VTVTAVIIALVISKLDLFGVLCAGVGGAILFGGVGMR